MINALEIADIRECGIELVLYLDTGNDITYIDLELTDDIKEIAKNKYAGSLDQALYNIIKSVNTDNILSNYAEAVEEAKDEAAGQAVDKIEEQIKKELEEQ